MTGASRAGLGPADSESESGSDSDSDPPWPCLRLQRWHVLGRELDPDEASTWKGPGGVSSVVLSTVQVRLEPPQACLYPYVGQH